MWFKFTYPSIRAVKPDLSLLSSPAYPFYQAHSSSQTNQSQTKASNSHLLSSTTIIPYPNATTQSLISRSTKPKKVPTIKFRCKVLHFGNASLNWGKRENKFEGPCHLKFLSNHKTHISKIQSRAPKKKKKKPKFQIQKGGLWTLTFSSRAILKRESASWLALWRREALSSRSNTTLSFSLSFCLSLPTSVSRFETLAAMAMDVIFRARSSWSYGSVGITDKISSGNWKSGPAPPPPPTLPLLCDIADRVSEVVVVGSSWSSLMIYNPLWAQRNGVGGFLCFLFIWMKFPLFNIPLCFFFFLY